MTHGRKVCNTLKEIRRQIAEKNEIEYATDDCRFEGECKGTCPKCDAEVKYLENELHKRTQLGKTAIIAGISLGIAGTFPACNAPQQTNTPVAEQEIAADTVNLDTIPVIPKDSVRFPDIVLDGITVGNIEVEDFEVVKETIPQPPEIVCGKMELTPTKDENILMGEVVETMPEFPGGDAARIKFLADNIKYPSSTRKFPPGKVVISFVVETDGSLSTFRILRSLHPLLDEEALRVVKMMPKWIPGEQMGKAVRIQYVMPVIFELNDE
ncbi:MAG: energy transducer TonB [Lentimicrobiaceae bacterium]|nr:energy transducer TonB [Lentimicrobiaceae bacterium]